MAVPFRKTSKTRRDKRRTHFKLVVPGLVNCPKCDAPKLSHRVCKSCGYYKGVKIISKKEKTEKQD